MPSNDAALAVVAVLVAVAIAAIGLALVAPGDDTDVAVRGDAGVATFDSADDFRAYLANASRSGGSGSLGSMGVTGRLRFQAEFAQEAPQADGGDAGAAVSGERASGGGGPAVRRASETNVQERGIDEPDVVETDGERIYVSRGHGERGETAVVDALPADRANVTDRIDGAGDMIRTGDVLVGFRDDAVVAHDVAGDHERRWSVELNSSLETARLVDGTLYLVLRSDVDRDEPCPIRPASVGGRDVTIPCGDVHHPVDPVAVDVTYDVLAVDPGDGTVEDGVSFTGTADNTVVYVSEDAIYTTYTESRSETDVVLDFLTGPGSDLFDDDTVDRFERLRGYDISDRAKRVELEQILEEWRRQRSGDDRLTDETELENRLRNYLRDHKRELVTTGIVKTTIPDLAVAATGAVPGEPLKQWSMDEHDGDLRIATTVGERGVLGAGVESENDVYVLDGDLDRRGSVQGMGEGQRIYGVRFMGDRGYVITFRRVDPLHVLDLSDPDDPRETGELKLPGFSTYLHPLGEGQLLGVGEEDGDVKAVVFDVSDPEDPAVEDDYVLSDSWSAVSESHHAFLIDRRHEVFFLPGNRGGHVFGYGDGGLELVRSIDVAAPRRAVYVNDYLYVVGREEIAVLDETTWDRVRTVAMGPAPDRGPYPGPRPIEPTVDPGIGTTGPEPGGGAGPVR